jgi:hypothetical protein
MPWAAKSECPPHYRAAVKRLINALPSFYLLPPLSGEVFESLEDCNRRLRGYALAEGFDVVRKDGGIKASPSYRFKCLFHGSHTQNNRKLEDRVEKDSEGKISSKRRRDATNVRQLQCLWSALYSYESIDKMGKGTKRFILTIQCDAYENHQLVNDPFTFPKYLKASKSTKMLCIRQ